jgi:hypothetical protein
VGEGYVQWQALGALLGLEDEFIRAGEVGLGVDDADVADDLVVDHTAMRLRVRRGEHEEDEGDKGRNLEGNHVDSSACTGSKVDNLAYIRGAG